MSSWKHSFERLSKHKYVAYIIHPKKVVCICGKKIKLNRKWEEDYEYFGRKDVIEKIQ